jgi:hypothetical protein
MRRMPGMEREPGQRRDRASTKVAGKKSAKVRQRKDPHHHVAGTKILRGKRRAKARHPQQMPKSGAKKTDRKPSSLREKGRLARVADSFHEFCDCVERVLEHLPALERILLQVAVFSLSVYALWYYIAGKVLQGH